MITSNEYIGEVECTILWVSLHTLHPLLNSLWTASSQVSLHPYWEIPLRLWNFSLQFLLELRFGNSFPLCFSIFPSCNKKATLCYYVILIMIVKLLKARSVWNINGHTVHLLGIQFNCNCSHEVYIFLFHISLSEAKDCMYCIRVNLNDYMWGKSVYYEVQDSSTD